MPAEKSRKQLKKEVLQLEQKVSDLQTKMVSTGDAIETQSIVGVQTLTMRYDAESREILKVNTPFADYVRMEKDELIGQSTKVLAPVLGSDIYKEISAPDPDVTTPPRITDAANKVYEVLTTEHSGVVDVVMRDMTEAQQFKSYVQRYFGLDFESLSDEDKRSLSFPERRFITISFTDLRGFTKFTESNNPEEVRDAINAYFDEVIEAAEENDVFPNQIVGDEVMVLYGAPKYHRDHPLRAVKTACEHIERVTRLRAEYAKRGREIPHCGIGINSGDVIVGDMGSSVRDRKTYTALGTAVNLAARLCSAATAGQIILSEATLNAVLRILPDDWEHIERIPDDSSDIFDADSGASGGKIEDVIPLPKSLLGKEVLIGPGVASKGEEAEFTFRYLYQIKAKGISEALPVLTVERTKTSAMSSSALSDDTEANEDGEMILGRYRLVAHIGRGGMGTVWRARDEFVNTVAIKMLNAGHGASETQVARFKREAKVMGKLAHRNICRIHEIGKAEGRIFIAMQFVDGISLDQLITHQSMATKSVHSLGGTHHRSRGAMTHVDTDFSSIVDSVQSAEAETKQASEDSMDGKVPPEDDVEIFEKTSDITMMAMTHQQTLAIIAKVCDAVQFAHERGVLHRDLKPANIMIGRDGEPIIMDFGLAKLNQRDEEDEDEQSFSISIEGQVVGTIEYMAPEQALSSKEVNEQADVYSIGAILYHLITGQKPFRSSGHILADAKALQEHEPVAPRKIDRYIDPDLETIILKSLQPDRSQRYHSVMQIRQDIEKYQTGDPISARKPTLAYRLKKKIRKHTVPFWLGVGLLFLLIGFASYYFYDWRKNYGGWKMVFEEDFVNGEINKEDYVALDKKGEVTTELWKERKDGVRLLKNQWLWIAKHKIRGDAKIEVKLRYGGDPEGFQVCLNGDRSRPTGKWDDNPVGYACRYGIWRGTMAAITANQESSPGDLNTNIEVAAPQNKSFLLTFQRKEGKLMLQVDKTKFPEKTVLLPLRGNTLTDVGFRTWSDQLIVESIRVFRFTLPEEASPTVAGDALVEINENELAIEKYLTIADDYGTKKAGTLALTKAFQLWFQTYLGGSEESPEQNQLRDRIEKTLSQTGRNRLETERIVAPLKAVDLFARKQHEAALKMFPDIVEANKDARIAIQCLQFDHQSIPKETAKELLPWIAGTPDIVSIDLHSLQLDDISQLSWINNLKALDIRNNELTSLEAVAQKKLKALYCMNNRITSLEPIQNMKLDELWCGSNMITDITPLTGMSGMHTFSCPDNQISDLSPLRGRLKTGYFYFDCSTNRITSIEALRDIGLSVLYCSNNRIEDLGPLEGKTDLYELNCSGNQITDLAPVANVPIGTLNCADNKITDLSPLAGKVDLYLLNCANNPIGDLSPLADVPIGTLDISGTEVVSIAPLIGHEHLQTLICSSDHEITDLDLLDPDVKIVKK